MGKETVEHRGWGRRRREEGKGVEKGGGKGAGKGKGKKEKVKEKMTRS